MSAMAKAALLMVAVAVALTGCGSSEPDFSQYTAEQVRGYCQLQYQVVQRAPVRAFSEREAFERYVSCLLRGKELSERY
jgi:hypothetical protein